jgi:hypothetical protein
MEDQRIDLDTQLTFLSYLKTINEDLIWESYCEVAADTLAQVRAEDVRPETIQLMNRLVARKIQ